MGAFGAADDITVDLLPRHDEALAHVQHNAAHPAPPTPASAPAPERVSVFRSASTDQADRSSPSTSPTVSRS